jgi:hypothetical protein
MPARRISYILRAGLQQATQPTVQEYTIVLDLPFDNLQFYLIKEN